MLSIVTGTLDRKHLLPGLIKNTVDSNEFLELVLIDGGSVDGSIDYIKTLSHPRVRLVEVGHRSPYSHYMNLGIKSASYEYICQWNDDAILLNPWQDVLCLVKKYDVCLFSWEYGTFDRIPTSWNLLCEFDKGLIDPKCGNQVVMNYGVYKKDIFRKIGMYDNSYQYYYADADMSFRTWSFGYKIYPAHEIKVLSLSSEINNKKAIHYPNDEQNYINHLLSYRKKELPSTIEIL
jgi:GT2 family glycosyltransferase